MWKGGKVKCYSALLRKVVTKARRDRSYHDSKPQCINPSHRPQKLGCLRESITETVAVLLVNKEQLPLTEPLIAILPAFIRSDSQHVTNPVVPTCTWNFPTASRIAAVTAPNRWPPIAFSRWIHKHVSQQVAAHEVELFLNDNIHGANKPFRDKQILDSTHIFSQLGANRAVKITSRSVIPSKKSG